MDQAAFPCPGLQPVYRITQEQVRSHVLWEGTPAKCEASHRFNDSTSLFVLTLEIAPYSQNPESSLLKKAPKRSTQTCSK